MTIPLDTSTELPMTEVSLLVLALAIGITVAWLWLVYNN